MKRSLLCFCVCVLAIFNLLGQTIETATCYTYLVGRESTLKYKFSYDEEKEKFYTNLRLIKGSESIFKVDDEIIIEPKEGLPIKFSFSKTLLEQTDSAYIAFETPIEDLNNLQKGIKSISLVREGKTYHFILNDYYKIQTKSAAETIIRDASTIKKINVKESIISKKREVIEARKEVRKEAERIGIPPAIYFRGYLGNDSFADNLNVGYTTGFRLGKENCKTYAQLGVQLDWNINAPKDYKLSVSLPLDLTYRFNLGESNTALSPFIGGIFKITPGGSKELGTLFQPGLEFGLNIDYKKLYIGTVYHIEFYTKNSLGHTRGLDFRMGINF